MTPLQKIAKLYDGYDTSDLNQLDHQILRILKAEGLIQFVEVGETYKWNEVKYMGEI